MKLSTWLDKERGRGVTLAGSIGVSPVLISQWSTGPRVPPIERCVPIERATDGEVTRADLRPDDYLDIWPELGEADLAKLAGQGVGLSQRNDPPASTCTSPDRRHTHNPPPPDLERREPEAAALAGQGVPG